LSHLTEDGRGGEPKQPRKIVNFTFLSGC